MVRTLCDASATGFTSLLRLVQSTASHNTTHTTQTQMVIEASCSHNSVIVVGIDCGSQSVGERLWSFIRTVTVEITIPLCSVRQGKITRPWQFGHLSSSVENFSFLSSIKSIKEKEIKCYHGLLKLCWNDLLFMLPYSIYFLHILWFFLGVNKTLLP